MTTTEPRTTDKERLERDRDAIFRKYGKTPEELYEIREKRVRDAIELKEPDRIPWVLMGGGAPGERHLPASAAYYDPQASREAMRETLLTVQPDLYAATPRGSSGVALELLDPKHIRWPGGNLPPDVPFQAVEQEYMKADEYDQFLMDPTEYTIRCLLPRAFGGLSPLSRFPSLTGNFAGFAGFTPFFVSPEYRKLAGVLLKAGEEQVRTNRVWMGFDEELAALGFPALMQGGGAGGAPFDAISDYLRGMTGSMLDMYRQPDKLLAACEKILQMRVMKAAPADPAKLGNPKRTWVPLHRGADGFMSKKQFETFYWPGLKKATLASINLGFVPLLICQGGWNERLEYLLDLPKGKAVAYLHQTDMKRAKETIGGHLCIMAAVQPSTIRGGSPQEIDEECLFLINTLGKDGGFILMGGPAQGRLRPGAGP